MGHLSAVRHLRLFDGLSDAEKSDVISRGKPRRCQSGDVLFLHGQPVRGFYLLCEGVIQLYRTTPDGHEVTGELAMPGDTLCDIEIFEGVRFHQQTARAIENALLLEFPLFCLSDCIEHYPRLALNLLAMMSRQMRRASIHAEHQSTMKAPQRVACFLQSLCVLYGADPSHFVLPYSKTLIASCLGIELETFSRALAVLKKEGFRVKGAVVRIPPGFAGVACDSCSIREDCEVYATLREQMLPATQRCAG